MAMRLCHQRVCVNLRVRFDREGTERHTMGYATDLSLGGMFIATVAPQPCSAKLIVRLSVPGLPLPLILHAVVRWTNACGMGVQFAPYGTRETSLITQLVHAANREAVLAGSEAAVAAAR
jgi:hypothetical protein